MSTAPAALPTLTPSTSCRTRAWLADLRAGRQPQWPLYAVAAAGYGVLVAISISRPGHNAHGSGDPWAATVGAHALGLLGMLAVMAPLVAWNARYCAMRAPSSYRSRVPVWVMAGWALGWLPLLAGPAVVIGVFQRLSPDTGGVLLALTTLVAIAWQWSAQKRRGLARCHATLAPPLAMSAARRACRRYGTRLGWNCGISCAPVMMVMMATGHSIPVVAALTGLTWYERRRCPHHDPRRATTVFVLVAVGVLALIADMHGSASR